MSNLLDLPEDVHLEICKHMGPRELLSLKQTCRVFHALGCTNHAWNQVMINLPLDLPLRSDKQTLPVPHLQRAVIRALRLEDNWKARSTRIRKLQRITCGNAFDQMQPLGPKWLISLSRSPSLTQIAVWDVGAPQCDRIASIDAGSALRFSADICVQSRIIIAVIEHNGPQNEQLNIYSFYLTEEPNGHGPSIGCLELEHSISKPFSKGSFFDVHVCGHVVAAAVARFSDPTSPPEYEIILVNTLTHTQWVSNPHLPPGVERVRLKLFLDRLILVGVQDNKTLIIYEFGLPPFVISGERHKKSRGTIVDFYVSHLPTDIGEAELILTTSEGIEFPMGFDVHLSTESANGTLMFMPIAVLPSLVTPTGGLAYMVRFPLFPRLSQSESTWQPRGAIRPLMQQFTTPAKTSADIMCIGRTGHRSIWIQRRWDNDEFEFMKTTFSGSSDEQVAVVPLLPKHTPLPFEPHACQSLALDEASGRLYMSIHTGEMFILDL